MAWSRPELTLELAMNIIGAPVEPKEYLVRPGLRSRRERLHRTFRATMVDGHAVVDSADSHYLSAVEDDLRAARRAQPGGCLPLYIAVMEDASPLVGSRFIRAGSPGQIQIYTTRQTPTGDVAALRAVGAQVRVVGGPQANLVAVLHDLDAAGIESILVEGEGALHARLLDLDLVDELALCIIPSLSGLSPRNPVLIGASSALAALRPRLTLSYEFDDDVVVLLYTLPRDVMSAMQPRSLQM